MKFKRIIVPFLALVLVASGLSIGLPILGDEDDYETVSMDTMAAQILGNNLEVMRANEDVMIAKYKHDIATNEKDEPGSSVYDTRMRERYNWKASERDYDYALWHQGQTKLKVLLEGELKLYDYQLLLQEIELEQAKLARLEKVLETLQLKVDLGRATTSELASQELVIEQQSFKVSQLVNEKDRLFLELNRVLGFDLATVLVPEAYELPFELFFTDGIEEDIERTMRTDGDLAKLEMDADLASIQLKIYDELNFSDQYEDQIISQKETISDLNFDLKDMKLNLEFEVRSAYNNLLNSKDTVQTRGLELDNLQLNLETLQKRFDVGLEIQSTLDEAMENVEFAELSLLKAQRDYYEAAENYQLLVGLK